MYYDEEQKKYIPGKKPAKQRKTRLAPSMFIEVPEPNTILSGKEEPTADMGEDGDFYIETESMEFYGPKTDGAWGEGRKLPGQDGKDGETGLNGQDGKDGRDGQDGAEGIGIASINQPIPGKIEIKLTNDESYFIDLPRGIDGKQIEMQAKDGYFQWRYIGEEWVNLAPVPQNFTGSGGGRMRLRDLEKMLVAGSNITITSNGSTLTIASTGGGGGTTYNFIDSNINVANYAALPSAASNNGNLAFVLSTTGSWPTKKYSGWYVSDGVSWLPADAPKNGADNTSFDPTGMTYATGDDAQEVIGQLDTKLAAITGLPSPTRSSTSGSISDPGSSCKYVHVRMFGGGAGGGSGRKGTGANRSGGAGGSAGQFVQRTLKYSELSGWPISYTIGAGGAGGAAQTTNSTNGNSGNNGGDTTFGSYVTAKGGLGGVGGTSTSCAGGMARPGCLPSLPTVNISGVTFITAGGTGVFPGSVIGVGGSGPAGSGGGGMGISSGSSVGAGGAGGYNERGDAGGTGGASGNAGNNGTAGDSSAPYAQPGGSGGGGAGSSTTAGYTGGNGGNYGGGGGGGSAGTDSVNGSGAGGNGADGWIEVSFS